MILELKKARSALALNGWVGPSHEPFCLDANGDKVIFTDEAAHTLSVFGALAAEGVAAEAFAILHRIVSPNAARAEEAQERGDLAGAFAATGRASIESESWSFDAWLQASHRTAGDVLRVLTTAIQRSKKTGRTT